MIYNSVTDDYSVQAAESEGFVFVHLDLYNWAPSVVKSLKAELEKAKLVVGGAGHDLMYLHTPDKKIIKLWEMCSPLYDLVEIDENYIGAWETGVENG